MAYVVVKGEKKLADVVGRAFGDLSAAHARRAEAAILRANPQLADPGGLQSGAVIVVPPVPGLRRAAADDAAAAPASELVAELSESLDGYRKELTETMRRERAAEKELTALLKSKELIAAARELPNERYMQNVTQGVKTRIEENDQREAFLKTLAKAKSDLDALAKTLGQ
jgi:hypothetical protein